MRTAPSVPSKFQGFGYEETYDGRLVPQNQLPLGYSGLPNDFAGPGDYDPDLKASSKFRSPKRVIFPKVGEQ